MREEQDRRERGRREFLRLAGLGAGAAAVATAVAGGEARAVEAEPESRGQGYRETPHVRKYYQLARF
jgi:DMSO/TMAO reductase YedYZ molybdopterin-dependent catalytic subunit